MFVLFADWSPKHLIVERAPPEGGVLKTIRILSVQLPLDLGFMLER